MRPRLGFALVTVEYLLDKELHRKTCTAVPIAARPLNTMNCGENIGGHKSEKASILYECIIFLFKLHTFYAPTGIEPVTSGLDCKNVNIQS